MQREHCLCTNHLAEVCSPGDVENGKVSVLIVDKDVVCGAGTGPKISKCLSKFLGYLVSRHLHKVNDILHRFSASFSLGQHRVFEKFFEIYFGLQVILRAIR